ncbi:MAG: 3-keto-5-aminohexanoate cleavage protein [Myxococcales bacterium]|nr:MAG: 3-keto-5-aminohexanoate cleavage protein [Myxococcales bacterium]
MSKVIITAAICGAEVTRQQQPALPIAARELAAEARRAVEAGAAIIHLHVRRDDGSPTQDLETFRHAMRAIRDVCDPLPIIQPSTGGAVGMSADERLQPVRLNPEMATLDCGTVNFGEEIFVNDLPLMRHFAREMAARDILPELECFDISHILSAQRLWEEGLLNGHKHFDLVLGIPGALDASAASLVEMVRRTGPDATWTAAAVGRHQTSVTLMALAMGGHVRVGFEDNIYLSKGVRADSNARFVERVVRIARETGREPATPDEARAILGIAPDRADRLSL